MHALTFGPEAAAAGFLFGLAAISGWLGWIVTGLVLICEFCWFTGRVAKERAVSATFLLLLVLVSLHLLGLVDVWNLFRYHALYVLYGTVAWFLFGLVIYSPIRGWLTARAHREEFAEELRDAKERWLSDKRRDSRSDEDFDPAKFEEEWQTKIKPQKWAQIISVEKDKHRVFFWAFFWPADILWKCVFQWIARLNDVFNFIWKRLSGVAQGIKNSALKGADKDI